MDRFASLNTARARWRLGAALAALATVVMTVVALAPVAEAHHSEIVGSTDCSLQVSWTATSWNPNADNGINHSVKVWSTPDNGSSAGTSTTVDVGHFDFDDGFQFGGTFPWPSADATSITLSVQEQVWWGANEDKAAPSSPRTTQVIRPSNCPATPSTSATVDCANGDGVATVTLKATGGTSAVTFSVTNPVTHQTSDQSVSPGATKSVTIAGLPDGTTTIPIVANGQHVDQTVDVSCDQPGVPSVTVTEQCQNFDGTATVTVGNTGGTEPVHFVVTNPVTHQDTAVDVVVGGSSTVTITGLPDGTTTIPVTADGVHHDQVVSVHCDHPGTPQVSATDECSATGGSITVTLRNTDAGSEPVHFVVTNPVDLTTTDVTVAAGATQQLVLAGLPDGSYSVAVTADGTSLPAIDLTIDCQQPGVHSIVVSCTDSGAAIDLTNDGGTPVEMIVKKDGTPVSTVTVDANGTAHIVVPLNPGETATITVEAEGELLTTQTVTQHCTEDTTPTTPPGDNPTTTVPSGATPPTLESTTTANPNVVLGSEIERDPQVSSTGTLPTTGIKGGELIFFAGLLLLAGSCIVVATRRRA